MLNNLLSWWDYEETTDVNRVDAHGSNDIVPTGSPSYRAGIVGNAIDFNGAQFGQVAAGISGGLSQITGQKKKSPGSSRGRSHFIFGEQPSMPRV